MRQHYVPQFLLRSWANGTPDGRVEAFRFDLPNLVSARRAPVGTGYEENLYSLTRDKVAGMDKHAVERHLLSHIDTAAAGVMQKLLTTGLKSIAFEERCDWIRFLVSLRLRQPHMIDLLRTQAAEGLRKSLASDPEEYEPFAGPDDPPTLEAWAESRFPGVVENFGMSFFHELVNSWDAAKKLLPMKWWLWDFSTCGNELLLADQPCIFTSGIDDPELMVALPISPAKAFMMTRSDRAADALRGQVPKVLLQRLNESSLNNFKARIYATDQGPRRFLENRFHLLPSKPPRSDP